MTIKYIMGRDEWESHVVSLLPDVALKTDTKENIAFDLAMEFGILSGLVPSGWYPDEAVEHWMDREEEKDNLSESDFDEHALKLKAYYAKMEAKHTQENASPTE